VSKRAIGLPNCHTEANLGVAFPRSELKM